jgi:hypothetical protein
MAGRNWRDYFYLVFNTVSLISMLVIDLSGFYPAALTAPGRPLHFTQQARTWYMTTHNDAFFLAGEDAPAFFHLLTKMELVFQLPLLVYILARYVGAGRTGTTPTLELASVVYGLHAAVTTLICLNDIQTWDPSVHSRADKNKLIFQLYGPWFVIRKSGPAIRRGVSDIPASLMCVDMYFRLLARFSSTPSIKKTQ